MNTPIVWIGTDRHALQACIDKGIRVLYVQGASGRDFGYSTPEGIAERIIVDDQRNVESVAAALARKGYGPGDVRAVASNDEGSLATAATLATYLQCPGPDLATVLRFRDKALQKSIVRAAGVPVAETIVVDDILVDDMWPMEIPWPVVAKPIAGAGSALTRLLDGPEAAEKFRTELKARRALPRTFVLESYVSGDELNIDGVMVDGDLRFLSIASYGEPCLSAIDSQRPLRTVKYDPDDEPELYASVRALAEKSLTALGLRTGIFHLEAFMDPDSRSLFFSECAARRGGALTEEDVLAKFGVSLAHTAIQLAVHGDWEPNIKVHPGAVGATYLPVMEGTLLSCPGADEILAQPGVTYARIDLPLGFQSSGSATNTIVKLGSALVEAPTRAAFNERVDELLAWFASRVNVLPPGLTTAELRELPQAGERNNEAGSFSRGTV